MHILEKLKGRFGANDAEFSVIIGSQWKNLKASIASGKSPRYKYICRAYWYAKTHGINLTIDELMKEEHDEI